MKNIIGICGSPRHNGNSEWALSYVLDECKSFANVSQINVSEKKIEECNGCLACEDGKKCPFNDDMTSIYNNLIEADIIIISTPVYFDNIPSNLKKVLDRTNAICDKLKGKNAYIFTFGQADENSWDRAKEYLSNYFEIVGINVLGSYSFAAREKDDAKNNVVYNQKLLQFAKNIKDIK